MPQTQQYDTDLCLLLPGCLLVPLIQLSGIRRYAGTVFGWRKVNVCVFQERTGDVREAWSTALVQHHFAPRRGWASCLHKCKTYGLGCVRGGEPPLMG